MMENTKCECGHQNHIGTVLCEACGKPLHEDHGTGVLEMRYDGVARRSQRVNPSWIDRIWRFFSSVKVAVYLILITLIGASIGTIFPQKNAFVGNVDLAQYYMDHYGFAGSLYYTFGFHDTFGSFWFQGLLVMIGASLVICSLDRVLPLYRALKKQKIRKHPDFIRRQRITFSKPVPESGQADSEQAWLNQFATALKKKHYRVHTEGTALLAEKNRFSRWGPYINHIGLIIFLLACLLRTMTAWQVDYVSVLEGSMKQIPGTHYYLENEKFEVEYYDQAELSKQHQEEGRMVVKVFRTNASLYQCVADCDGINPELELLKQDEILVNHPLKHDGISIYEVHFENTPQLTHIRATLKLKDSGEAIGTMNLNMSNPDPTYQLGDYEVRISNYYPDVIFKDGKLGTNTNNPNSPAFVFVIHGPGLPEEGDVFVYFVLPVDQQTFSMNEVNEQAGSHFQMEVGSMEDVGIAQYTTYFNVKYDKSMPYVWTGAAISMLGLILGFYWQHRRIWLYIDEQGQLELGAHTNKNWYGFRLEIANALRKTGIEVDGQALQNEVNVK